LITRSTGWSNAISEKRKYFSKKSLKIRPRHISEISVKQLI
jgi:hypothetical protein